MIDQLINLFTSYISDYGYYLAFAISFLENSIFLGLIMPGDTIILLSGFYAGQGALSFPLALALIIIGAALGDNIGFLLGRKLGTRWLKKYGPKIGYRQEKIKRAELFWERHGEKAIIIGDFMSYLRTFVPFFAGTSKMSQKRFMLWDLLAVTAHATILITLGYFFGEYWEVIRAAFGVFGIIMLIVFVLLLYKYFTFKGSKKIES